MHNRIEKSGFHAGQYVGYCDGVWRIKRDADLWAARKVDGSDYFRARTLDAIGHGLDLRANIATGKALFS